jgi:hypothetical protein
MMKSLIGDGDEERKDMPNFGEAEEKADNPAKP